MQSESDAKSVRVETLISTIDLLRCMVRTNGKGNNAITEIGLRVRLRQLLERLLRCRAAAENMDVQKAVVALFSEAFEQLFEISDVLAFATALIEVGGSFIYLDTNSLLAFCVPNLCMCEPSNILSTIPIFAPSEPTRN